QPQWAGTTYRDVFMPGIGGGWRDVSTWSRIHFDGPEYLNEENAYAGTIHRLVTVGTPFDGSEWANTAMEGVVKAANLQDFTRRADIEFNRARRGFAGEAIGWQAEMLTLIGNDRLAIVDLMAGSKFQRILDSSVYPTAHRRVRWHTLVGVAMQTGNEPGNILEL